MLKLKIKFNFVVILMGSFSGGLTCLVKEPMVKTGSYIKTTNYNHFQFIPNSVDLVHYGVAPQNQVLHFNMSRNIYNYWFLRLQSLGPEKKIIQAERTNIYKHFVGVLPLAEYNSI